MPRSTKSSKLDENAINLIAQDIVNGSTPKEAANRHGFTSPATIYNAKIRERVAELIEERGRQTIGANQLAEAATGITKERVLLELWDNAMKAKSAKPVLDSKGNPTGQFVADLQASNRALQLCGQELGMFTKSLVMPGDRPGLFDGWSSTELRAFIAILNRMEQQQMPESHSMPLPNAERVD